MAWGDKKSTKIAELEPPTRPKSLIASAARIKLEDRSWNAYRFKDEAWQRELWRLYDIVPEFRFSANWVGSACSRVRIYVAKVDKLGRRQEEVEGPAPIAALSETLFGGPTAKAEALRAMGINFTVAGECYVLGLGGNAGKGDWFIVSPSELRRVVHGDGTREVLYGERGSQRPLTDGQDILIRCWTPHPRFMQKADSPGRSVQPVLREIEQLTKYVFSQIDSRLVSAGILPIPNNMDFPTDGDEDASASQTLMAKLAEAGSASLKGEGTAAGVLPMIIEVPTEALDKIKLITFDSALSAQALELRQEAIRRLSLGMDMPPEVLTGMGESNHWCKTDNTEAFTQDRGWVTHDQLVVGDVILTLNHETGLSEWQPILDIYRAPVRDEPMLRMKSRSHDSVSTLGHRWAVTRGTERRWTTSGEGFKSVDRVPVSAVCTSLNAEAKHTDDFVRLVAAYTSDGSLLTQPSGSKIIRIVKFSAHEITELRRIMVSVFGDRFREHAHPTSTVDGTAFILNVQESKELQEITGPDKMVKRSFINDLTLSQMNLFLDSMIDIGDGIRRGNARIYYQVVPERLDPIEQAAILAGFKVTRGVRNQQTGFGTTPLSWIQVSSSRHSFSPWDCEQTRESYTGTVWCPTTATGTWYARSNGSIYITGNSAWHVEESAVKIHIEPIMGRICDALTKGYLAPALKALGKDPDGYCYWFDTSPLTVRPQRLQDTLNLFEKGIVGAKAVLAAGAYLDSDGITEEDDRRRFTRELVLRDPTLITVPEIREIVGLPDFEPPAIEPGAPPPPNPATGIQSTGPDPLPNAAGSTATNALGGPGGGGGQSSGNSVTASVQVSHTRDQVLMMGAESIVWRALERAGTRLLDRGSQRGQFPGVPAYELHTKMSAKSLDQIQALLEGAWVQVPVTANRIGDLDSSALQDALSKYCTLLLMTGTAHHVERLRIFLGSEGLLHVPA